MEGDAHEGTASPLSAGGGEAPDTHAAAPAANGAAMEAAEREEPETQESTEHAEEQDSPPSDPGAKAASEQPYDAGEVLGDGGADLAPGAVRVSEQTIVAVQLGELGRLTALQAQQLELEGRTRAELEDMLQRIERHIRNEQAVRRRAEEAETAAAEEVAHERDVRLRLEDELRTRGAEAQQTDALKAALQADHLAMEKERARIKQELQVARNEAKRALAVLAKTEEAVRQAEAMERLKMEAEHNARVTHITSELDGLREELDMRTRVMSREMARWRAQAEAATAAVRDAKEELMDRKRELDVTKERMDGLVEKLYIGRERGLELRGAITSHLERLRASDAAKTRGLKSPDAAPPPVLAADPRAVSVESPLAPDAEAARVASPQAAATAVPTKSSPGVKRVSSTGYAALSKQRANAGAAGKTAGAQRTPPRASADTADNL